MYQHVSQKHLKRYLGGFDFRSNERGITDAERADKALKGITGKRLTYPCPRMRRRCSFGTGSTASRRRCGLTMTPTATLSATCFAGTSSRRVASGITARVGLDHAGIHGEALATNQPARHASPHHAVEDLAKHVAVAEAPVAVDRKRRVTLSSSPSRQSHL